MGFSSLTRESRGSQNAECTTHSGDADRQGLHLAGEGDSPISKVVADPRSTPCDIYLFVEGGGAGTDGMVIVKFVPCAGAGVTVRLLVAGTAAAWGAGVCGVVEGTAGDAGILGPGLAFIIPA